MRAWVGDVSRGLGWLDFFLFSLASPRCRQDKSKGRVAKGEREGVGLHGENRGTCSRDSHTHTHTHTPQDLTTSLTYCAFNLLCVRSMV